MVLRIRIRSAKLHKDLNSYNRMSPYVALIGGGNKFRTVTDKEGGKQPVWEETLVFPGNPPNIKLEVWVEHPNGDMLAGQILIDLCNFYQREPYRIQPKTINLVQKKQITGQIKIQLDFDYDGMSTQQMNRIKAEGIKPEIPSNDLQVGTVIAIGKKAMIRNHKIQQQQMQMNNINDRPYQKPPTAPTNQNNKYQKKQPQYNYNNDPWRKPIEKKKSYEENKYYNNPNPWPTNNNSNDNGNNWDNWGNNNNNNNNNNTARDGDKGYGNNVNIKKNDIFEFFGNIINGNEQAKKEPAKNNGWDDWKQPQKRDDNRRKDDPWRNNPDPYGNNNGWDL